MNLSDVALLAKEELSIAEKGIASAKVVLTGFVVVFAMLILLIFIIKIYGAIIQKAQDAGKKSKEKKAETVAETPAPVVAAPVAPAYFVPAAHTDSSVIMEEAVKEGATNPLNAPSGFAAPQTNDAATETPAPSDSAQ